MVRVSLEVLVTTTSKVNVPPGSGRERGSAVFSTAMAGRPVRVTVASSSSVTCTPTGFSPTTVTVSVWESPELPVKSPSKLHT